MNTKSKGTSVQGTRAIKSNGTTSVTPSKGTGKAILSIMFLIIQSSFKSVKQPDGSKVKQEYVATYQREYNVKGKEGLNTGKCVSAFAHYMEREARKVEHLKAAGFKCNGFSMVKPFRLQITANDAIMFDSQACQMKSLTSVVLQGRKGAKIEQAINILAESSEV